MNNFLKKRIKTAITLCLTVITTLLCIVLEGTQCLAAGSLPGRKAVTVLVVPARPRVIQFALELAGMRNITLVSFREQSNAPNLLIYVWEKNGWRYISCEDFAALKFIKGTPDAAVVIGDDQVVPKELVQNMVWPCKVERIQSVLITDLINGLNKYFHFSSREWKKLAHAYDLTLSQSDGPSSSAPTNALPPAGSNVYSPSQRMDRPMDKDRQKDINPVQAEMIDDENIQVQEKKAEREEEKNMPGKDIRLILGKDVDMVFIWLESLSIWAGQYEVTNDQYERFDRAHDPKKYYDHTLNISNQPVVFVSWEDANNYCSWLNRNFRSQIPAGYEYRLPTEREWIVFAKCGGDRKYPWGDKWPPPDSFNYKGREGSSVFYNLVHNERFIRNHNDGFIVAAPVKKSGANEWGLWGVGGNVWEWCQDWFDETKTTRVLHGAAWNNYEPAIIAISNRSAGLPEKGNAMIGFRVVIAPRKK